MSLNTPILALRNIGLSARDLMAAINSMGTRIEFEPPFIPRPLPPDQATDSTDLKALDTFTCFGRLPSELRFKIWKHACYHPRNIDIFTDTLGKVRVNDENTYEFQTYKYFSHFCSHPSVLQTCRESREEGLRHYKLDFGTSHEFSIITIKTPPRIYVNFACDRICLLEPDCFESDDEDRFLNFIEICRKNKVRSLAINIAQEQHWPYVDVSTAWDALEEIIIFDSSTDPEGVDEEGEIGFVRTEDLASCLPKYQIQSQGLDHVAMSHLQLARRDFFTLFDFHEAGMKSMSELEGNDSLFPERTWTAPSVNIRHLTIGGKAYPSKWQSRR